MKKLILSIGIIGLFLTGCGSYSPYMAKIPAPKEASAIEKCSKTFGTIPCNSGGDIIGVATRSFLSNYGFTHTLYNNTTAAALQTAAFATLKNDKKYFAIFSPATLANTNGVMLNTAEEYFKKCDISMASLFQRDPCSLHGRSNGTGAMLQIITFDEPINDMMVYNAKDVLDYIKKEKRYDEELEKVSGSWTNLKKQ